MIRSEEKKWVIKPPKTPGSVRNITLPKEVINAIPIVKPNERCIQATPDQISHRFDRALKASGLPSFRFHDLRHYAASSLHAWGVPDSYIMKRGGWSSDYVMKRVYRGVISDEEHRLNEKIYEKIALVIDSK